jgi:RHS repeat-associated protein
VAGATTDTDSIVDAAGNRLGVKQGSTVNWFLPDLHGNIAASLQSDEAKVSNAIRYDAWGQTVATGSQSGSSSPVGQDNWKYQGRLDVSPVAGSPLYDMSARFYSPGIGAFTQLDTVAGSAQNPLSMNRFLYAEANPATMIDPTGHCVRWQDNYCADARSGGTNAIQKQHQKKVHNDEIRRRNNANRTREYSVESRSTNRSTLTNGQIAKARYLNLVAAANNKAANDSALGNVGRGNAMAMASYAELARTEMTGRKGDGSSLLPGCRLGDTLCLIGKQIGGLRTGASAALGCFPPGRCLANHNDDSRVRPSRRCAFHEGGSASIRGDDADDGRACHQRSVRSQAGRHSWSRARLLRIRRGRRRRAYPVGVACQLLTGKAPRQVTPGTHRRDGTYIHDGVEQPWVANYVQFGRQIGRTDYNAGDAKAGNSGDSPSLVGIHGRVPARQSDC